MKSKLFTIAKIAVSVLLIAYVFSKVPVKEVAASLAAANPWWIALALALFIVALAINSIKWLVLLRAQQVNVPFRIVLQLTFVGIFFNNLLPANIGGDVMRGYGMARYTDRTAQAAVSVVLDRFIGLIAYVATAAVMSIVLVVFLGQSNLRWLEGVAFVSLAALGGTLAFMLSRRLRGLIGMVFKWRPLQPLAPMFEGVSSAFEAYRFQYMALVYAFLLALAGLMVTNLVNWLLFHATGGDVPFSYVLLFNPLIALVLLLPISFGGHGLIQGAYPFFYGLAGVPQTQAVAVSVLMSFIIIISSLPGGVLWLRMRRASDEENPPVPAEQPTS
ncbi:MAG: flippase-like domain-containing protein [Anaerolineae bacterium]|nr:flippase-like domain-containing protein [Anaerolineae bacterium]MCB9133080.1 flippase-like domain-containing protein [Anaerolineales bacterium]MCB0243359.1 flippase-like domain-containing protein [Anaerolineae bacterium]MCB0248499.1 flippase-like domain-containing protein [Anaerolineae bacterium]MCO5244069.1 flippase-like domain-containing protein [Anaerolineae bacterium]